MDGRDLIAGDREIMLALQKRFKNKRTLHGDPRFADILTWCMSTDSYKVCQKNFEGVSDSDVDLVWQFIDTLSVSSTRACRDVMNKFKGARSAVGFRREHTKPSVSPRTHRPGIRSAAPPALVPHSDKDKEGYNSLEDVITQDCMHWVLSSSDPTASALLLRSGLLEGNKGGHYGRAHE